jgi:hypothetical protein
VSGPVKRRYILAASDAPALAHAAADVTNAMVVALCKAESERDALAMQLSEVRAELAEARGARLSSVLTGCCEFIAQRDALLARVSELTLIARDCERERDAARAYGAKLRNDIAMLVKTENAPAVDRGATGA